MLITGGQYATNVFTELDSESVSHLVIEKIDTYLCINMHLCCIM